MWRLGRLEAGEAGVRLLEAEWDASATPGQGVRAGRSIHLQFTGYGRTLSGVTVQKAASSLHASQVDMVVCPSFEACGVVMKDGLD